MSPKQAVSLIVKYISIRTLCMSGTLNFIIKNTQFIPPPPTTTMWTLHYIMAPMHTIFNRRPSLYIQMTLLTWLGTPDPLPFFSMQHSKKKKKGQGLETRLPIWTPVLLYDIQYYESAIEVLHYQTEGMFFNRIQSSRVMWSLKMVYLSKGKW